MLRFNDLPQYFLFILILLLASCNVPHDERLMRIAETLSQSPDEALDSLKNINESTLSVDDRHYRNFLIIKAADKAYHHHESDRRILEVMDYYSSHDKEHIYPEVLYYGGRVYSDLGDAPTALRYFQQSLELIPDHTEKMELRSTVLSQTGRLLEKCRLYDEAVPFLEEAISINSLKNDTVNLSSNLELLGVVYCHLKQYDKAERCLKRSLEMNPNPMAKVYIADIEYAKGNLPAAVEHIGNMVDSVENDQRPYVAATAALIYHRAGLMDSVYHLATELMQQDDNQHIGYFLMINEDMKDYITLDSLYSYIQGYVVHTEKHQDAIMREKILMQETSFNYRRHEQEKERLMEENIMLKNRLIIGIGLWSGLCIIFLLVLIYRTNQKFILMRVLDNLRQLQYRQEEIAVSKVLLLESDKGVSNPDGILQRPTLMLESNKTESDIRRSVQNNMKDLLSADSFHLSDCYLDSEVHTALQKLLSSKKPIPENSELWGEIEVKVNEGAPNFKRNLLLLTDGKLKSTDYAIALLIKCGYTTSQMAILLSRAKNTISSRKESLSKRIFKEKRPPKDLETLIYSL